MKVQVSKVFASFINQVAKDRNLNFSAEVVEIPSNSYGFLIGHYWSAYNDYNAKTGQFRAICIQYPREYYAPNRYISTNELNRLFRFYGVETVDDLSNMIADEFSI